MTDRNEDRNQEKDERPENSGDGLDKPARLRRDRRDSYRRTGERSLGENLAMIGALGWLVVTPTLVGTFAGRWIDRTEDTGIFWTTSLLFLGLCIGCWMAWRKMQA